MVFYNEKTGLPRPVQATIVAIYTAESGSHLPLRLDTDYPLTLTDRIYRVSRHGITKFKPLSEFELLPGEYKRCVRIAGSHEPHIPQKDLSLLISHRSCCLPLAMLSSQSDPVLRYA